MHKQRSTRSRKKTLPAYELHKNLRAKTAHASFASRTHMRITESTQAHVPHSSYPTRRTFAHRINHFAPPFRARTRTATPLGDGLNSAMRRPTTSYEDQRHRPPSTSRASCWRRRTHCISSTGPDQRSSLAIFSYSASSMSMSTSTSNSPCLEHLVVAAVHIRSARRGGGRPPGGPPAEAPRRLRAAGPTPLLDVPEEVGDGAQVLTSHAVLNHRAGLTVNILPPLPSAAPSSILSTTTSTSRPGRRAAVVHFEARPHPARSTTGWDGACLCRPHRRCNWSRARWGRRPLP